jgi:hypothetical protein
MKTWKPTTAGILSITSGAITVILGLGHLTRVGLGFVGAAMFWGTLTQGILSLAAGLIAIVGGIVAIKRRFWGFALAGAVCSIYSPHLYGRLLWTPVLGILAIVFLVLSKNEFSNSNGKSPKQ